MNFSCGEPIRKIAAFVIFVVPRDFSPPEDVFVDSKEGVCL
jgi:hypothetical protein